MKTLGGSIPQIINNAEGPRLRRLFFSQREIALIMAKTFAPGYGYLQAGTVCALNASAAGNGGMLVPFVPAPEVLGIGQTDTEVIAMLVVDGVSDTIQVSVRDSYKFVVGDELICQDLAGDGAVDAGVITAIDQTSDTRFATITCGAYTATNMTVAKKAYCYVKTGAATPYSTAMYVLDKDIDTGIGPDPNLSNMYAQQQPAGANASVVVSNAILYKSSLINASAAALVSLGAISDGQFVILK